MKAQLDARARAFALRAQNLFDDDRPTEAALFAAQALALAPDDAISQKLVGISECVRGDHAAGLVYLERACLSMPEDANLHYNMAVAHECIGSRERAALSYRNCLRLQPDHADALWNYGEYLRLNGHFEAAARCFEALQAQDRRYPALHHRMAVVYTHLRRFDEAGRHFALAMDENIDTRLTRWERAHFRLGTRDFVRGWQDYDTRFDIGHLINVHCHPFPFPVWQGEPVAGKTLLVHGEQGLGDEIMFASIVPDLVRHASRVVLACAPSLVTLFQRAFPAAIVRAHRVGISPARVDDLGKIDYQSPIGSLPRWLRTSAASFGAGAPYLTTDPERVAWFGARLHALAPRVDRMLKVGLMWGSNPAASVPFAARRATRKSMPLQLLAPLAQVPDVQYVSVQNAELGEQAAAVPGLDLIDFSSALRDFSDTAALIANLDIVVSVDTSVAHLAGALGKTTYALLMRDCDWRYGFDGERCVWYESMTLLRQTTQDDWLPVVDQVIDALKRHHKP
ncbi:tetratricopeptide repeat-containing glycosyltransferase family protein [Burkholderia oklahomensis]|uniref:tetratricopeptide repeat-containing glycosyltransferase family protein n=1 Tax=Burkholderia oklahomensis TaxID=342113 RepID=UPI00264F0203|nr:tetratricopeptide repeat-containing glycosyltransferase family protein [Burkholderia oklahomensis]MDN7676087.1 tetratricopeptide repeat-containing glycosyltransferase family protein [Burkholderia oklahomensis]